MVTFAFATSSISRSCSASWECSSAKVLTEVARYVID